MSHAPEISQELAYKMADLIRDLRADHLKYDLHDRAQDFCERTAAIVALLPEPVDPDEAEAMQLAAEIKCGGPSVALALAALKRGRQLATSEALDEFFQKAPDSTATATRETHS